MRNVMAIFYCRVSFAALCTVASAQELPKSGSIHFHSGFGANYAEVEVADKRLQGNGSDNGITYNDKGSGPLHEGPAICSYSYVINDGKGQFQGYCTWSDAGGDKIFTTFDGTGGADGLSEGTNRITGGTGRYAGIQGSGPWKCKVAGRAALLCNQRLDYRLP